MICGNISAEIQIFDSICNEIGEAEKTWKTVQTLKGFLDLCGGDSDYKSFDAKVQDSTHVFICDFLSLNSLITAENCRMKINDRIYDIMLIDNPMGLDKHYEFYLKYIGGEQNI